MSFPLFCECGATSTVGPSQAGATILCRCGRSIVVPSLSELRKSVGNGAYEASIFDTIHRMLSAGELPAGRTCVLSDLPTADVCNVYVLCESQWTAKPGLAKYLVYFLLFLKPWLLIGFLMSDEKEEIEVRGHDRGISVPLLVHRDHQDRFRRLSSSQLRKLLRAVPIYARLLDEYPQAKFRT